MASIDPANVATNYFKVAHLSEINYTVFDLAPPLPDNARLQAPSRDQLLLELELSIRHAHPNVLLTYYNKVLYLFEFAHAPQGMTAALADELPALRAKCNGAAKVAVLVNPPRPISAPAPSDTLPETYLPYLSLTLLKAVKKLILYRLCSSGSLQLFGNYAVMPNQHAPQLLRYVVHVDPLLLANGDLLVSVTQNNTLCLFDSAIIPADCATAMPLVATLAAFALYIVPSGIRCHLYHAAEPSQNFTYTPPRNSATIVNLIRLSTGIDLTKDNHQVLWVKLVPNLQHLNNQTSKISHYLHSVNNKKFILWPWELCLLHFGHTSIDSGPDAPVSQLDPMHLILDFIDFGISHQHSQPAQVPSTLAAPHQPHSVPSVVRSTGSPDAPVVQHLPTADAAPPDAVRSTVADDVVEGPETAASDVAQNPDDSDMDDLFGEDSDAEAESRETPKDDDKSDHGPAPIPAQQLSSTPAPGSLSASASTSASVAPYLDIPKDQMTISAKAHPKPAKTPYNDPGAPLPLMATPFHPPSSTFPSAPAFHQPNYSDLEDVATSTFLPLQFNPIIKTNIDTKYGRGGKFYFQRESDPKDEGIQRPIRATSVTAYQRDTKPVEAIENMQTGLADTKHSDNMSDSMNEDESDEDDNFSVARSPSPRLSAQTQAVPLMRQHPDFTQSDPPVIRNASPALASASRVTKMEPAPMDVGLGFAFGGHERSSASEGESDRDSYVKVSLDEDVPLEESKSDPLRETPAEHNVDILGANGGGGSNTDNGGDGPLGFTESTPSSGARLDSSTPVNASTVESSNCLPLILRCINVSTIPPTYLWHGAETEPTTNFMYVDDEDNGWGEGDAKSAHKLFVRSNIVDDFLRWLTPFLVFDMGKNMGQFQKHLKLDPLAELCQGDSLLDGELIGFEAIFEQCFPLSYRLPLSELIYDWDDMVPAASNAAALDAADDSARLEDQLSFLDDITSDLMLNPKTQMRRIRSLTWDLIHSDNEHSQKNSAEHRSIIANLTKSAYSESLDSFFKLATTKVKVYKNKHTIVNMNRMGLGFWPYLKFGPVNGPKSFQMVLVTETTDEYLDCNSQFLSALAYDYSDRQFGNISQLNLISEGRPEYDAHGIIQVDAKSSTPETYYRYIDKSLSSLAESIRLDLIYKTNRFEFDRPLLLMFINFDDSISSLVKISKLCRNFQAALHQHQVPLVEVFSTVIPWTQIFKRSGKSSKRLRYLSSLKLSKISSNLYNQCPDLSPFGSKGTGPVKLKSSFTELVEDPPTKINFRLLGSKDAQGSGNLNGEVFLHLAYERSIDKNWLVASWSDSQGQVTFTKSWYCSPTHKSALGSHELAQICDDVWEISLDLFKKLNENIVKEMSGFGGKKFLVLTRINSVIPDDELVHWKRLSVKHKDVSLVVLSVNGGAKCLFRLSSDSIFDTANGQLLQMPLETKPEVAATAKSDNDFFKQFSIPESTESSPNGVTIPMSNSPFNGQGVNFYSPLQYSNAAANFLSPLDLAVAAPGHNTGTPKQALSSQLTPHTKDWENAVSVDPQDTIHAVIPKVPLLSHNSPTRLGMKIGYLMREASSAISGTGTEFLVYEVSLLSCSNYWNLDNIMRIILQHYKKMISLSDILCISDNAESMAEVAFTDLVPWHVAAVTKALGYLVHIEVED
jgi:mediator of RNA polymerase II transcription subunit 13